jgi:hypothetical protein
MGADEEKEEDEDEGAEEEEDHDNTAPVARCLLAPIL